MGFLRTRAVVILAACLAPAAACSERAPVALPSTPAVSHSAAITPSAAGPAPTLLREVTAIGAGARHACARLTNGTIVCWGANDRGQLGEGPVTSSAVAVPVPGIDHAAELAVSSSDFACARHEDGGVSCWGHGAQRPVRIVGVAGAVQIAAGDGAVACAVIGDTTVRCWTMDDAGKPATDPAPGLRDVVDVATAADHSCARLKSGALRCWGDNSAGQLGDGTRETRGAPVAVVDLPRALSVAVSPARSCALLPNLALACWGSAGWSCDASIPDRAIPVGGAPGCGHLVSPRPRIVRGVTHVAALPEGRLGCVALDRGGVACWDERADAPAFPGAAVPVEGITGAVAVSAGERYACALVTDGTVRCWGEDDAGQLGNGALAQPSTVPVAVLRR